MEGRLLSIDNGIGRRDADGEVLRTDAEYTNKSPLFPGLSIGDGGFLRLFSRLDSQAGWLSMLRGFCAEEELTVVRGVPQNLPVEGMLVANEVALLFIVVCWMDGKL